MKNLANCTPTEFVQQTYKIKESVEKWLKITDIQNIRKRKIEIDDSWTKEERLNATRQQAKQNIKDIIDSVFFAHPAETMELLALCCFVEPSEIDNHQMSEYFGCLSELMDDDNVISFLSSLMSLAKRATSVASTI